MFSIFSSCSEKHHKCIILTAATKKQLSVMLCNKDSKIQITTDFKKKLIHKAFYILTWILLVLK